MLARARAMPQRLAKPTAFQMPVEPQRPALRAVATKARIPDVVAVAAVAADLAGAARPRLRAVRGQRAPATQAARKKHRRLSTLTCKPVTLGMLPVLLWTS